MPNFRIDKIRVKYFVQILNMCASSLSFLKSFLCIFLKYPAANFDIEFDTLFFFEKKCVKLYVKVIISWYHITVKRFHHDIVFFWDDGKWQCLQNVSSWNDLPSRWQRELHLCNHFKGWWNDYAIISKRKHYTSQGNQSAMIEISSSFIFCQLEAPKKWSRALISRMSFDHAA